MHSRSRLIDANHPWFAFGKVQHQIPQQIAGDKTWTWILTMDVSMEQEANLDWSNDNRQFDSEVQA